MKEIVVATPGKRNLKKRPAKKRAAKTARVTKAVAKKRGKKTKRVAKKSKRTAKKAVKKTGDEIDEEAGLKATQRGAGEGRDTRRQAEKPYIEEGECSRDLAEASD